MSNPSAWNGRPKPDRPSVTWRGWLRVLRRGPPVVLLVFGGLVVLLVARLIEVPFFGVRRPVTPWITVGVCRGALRLMGIARHGEGRPMTGEGAQVANHASWLDIFALNAGGPLYFVSKAEVAGWPGIGWLARATGTVFIERRRAAAAAQREVFRERLRAYHRLLFFPEGTSTDGLRVLPFKTTLFAAFTDPDLRDELSIQPVAVDWIAPPGRPADHFGWWGEEGFAEHALAMLAARPGGAVRVTYLPPVAVRDLADRKALARWAETAIRDALSHEPLPEDRAVSG